MAYQEFICVGGPLDGQKRTIQDVPEDYHDYNRAGRDRSIPSRVLVHESIFNASQAPKLPRMSRRRKAEAPRDSIMQMWEVERTV